MEAHFLGRRRRRPCRHERWEKVTNFEKHFQMNKGLFSKRRLSELLISPTGNIYKRKRVYMLFIFLILINDIFSVVLQKRTINLSWRVLHHQHSAIKRAVSIDLVRARKSPRSSLGPEVQLSFWAILMTFDSALTSGRSDKERARKRKRAGPVQFTNLLYQGPGKETIKGIFSPLN